MESGAGALRDIRLRLVQFESSTLLHLWPWTHVERLKTRKWWLSPKLIRNDTARGKRTVWSWFLHEGAPGIKQSVWHT